MKKEMVLVLLGLFAFMIFMSNVSAEILLSQPANLYNIGDSFSVNVGITENSNKQGFLISEIVCSGSKAEIYRAPLSVSANVKKEVVIAANMDRYLIGDLTGQCVFKFIFAGTEKSTQGFEISDEVKVTLSNLGFSFNPGDQIKVTGSAIKKNSVPLEGFVDASIDGIGLSYSSEINQGGFDFSFTIPNDAKSGLYDLKVYAYDKDFSDNIRNKGEQTASIRVNQIPKEIDVALSSQNVSPGEDVVYNVLVSDQAGEEVKTDVGLVIYDPSGKQIVKDLVKSGESLTFKTRSNYSSGYWTFEAKLGDLIGKRSFLVETLENVSYSINNATLKVVNTGNVPYNKEVKFSIGNTTLTKSISLEVGETKFFTITAPSGEYVFEIYDGKETKNFGSTSLTGNAVSIKDLGGELSINISTIIWILLLIILAVAGAYYYIRIKKQKASGKISNFGKFGTVKGKIKESAGSIEKGEKQECGIIALKIKNFNEVMNSTSNAPDSISSAIEVAKSAKAKILSNQDYRVMIFSPTKTGEKDVSLSTVKVSKRIEDLLKEHNRRYSQKIEFGLGVNIGSLIVESKDSDLNFISAGNTIAIARRIAELADKETLLSDDIHKRTLANVKAERTDNNYWRIRRVIQRDPNSKFINEFMKRQ